MPNLRIKMLVLTGKERRPSPSGNTTKNQTDFVALNLVDVEIIVIFVYYDTNMKNRC